MKKRVKKLVLSKDTIAALLVDRQLSEAAGGVTFSCGSCGARLCEYDPSYQTPPCG